MNRTTNEKGMEAVAAAFANRAELTGLTMENAIQLLQAKVDGYVSKAAASKAIVAANIQIEDRKKTYALRGSGTRVLANILRTLVADLKAEGFSIDSGLDDALLAVCEGKPLDTIEVPRRSPLPKETPDAS